jgi:hypothetical protein
MPGVYYFCVKADAFNAQTTTQRLQQVGAKVEMPEVSGSIRFRDLDGMLIQVQ